MAIESNSGTDLMTVAEVAQLLRVSTMSVRRLQYQRRLPFLKIGGSVRFLKRDVLSYIGKQRIDSIV